MTRSHPPPASLVGRLLLVGLLVVGSLASAQSISHSDETSNTDQAEDPGRLRVTAVTNAAEVLSTLTFNLTDTTTSRTVMIRSDGNDIPVTNVAFNAVLDGAGAMVTPTGLPDGPLTFTPTTTQIVTLSVTITDPARFGSWRGAILATSGDVTEPIATLEVNRLRPSNVSILGAANGVLSVSRLDPSPTVTVVAAAGAGGARNLRISFGDLIDASGDGQALAPKNAPDGLTLEPFARHLIEIPLDLPSAGAHNSVITLTHGEDQMETVTLNVIRTQRQPAIDAPATVNVRLTQPFWSDSDLSFKIPLTASNGTGVALAAPSLVDFGLVDEAVRYFGSKQTIKVSVTPVDVGSTDGEGESVSEVSVTPDRPVDLTVTAKDVGTIGIHQGTLRLAEVGGLPLDIPVAIAVQRHWLWLTILVLIGSVAGYFLRNGRRNLLAKLGREETVLAITQELDRLSDLLPKGSTSTIADTHKELVKQAKELQERTKSYPIVFPAKTDNQPESLTARVRLLVPWASLVDLIDELQCELGLKLEQTKEEAGRIKNLIIDKTAIFAVVEMEHDTIGKLRTIIRGLRQDHYQELVKTLKDATEAYLEQLPPELDLSVMRKLDTASLLGDVNAGRYAAAAKEHDRLRTELLGLLYGDLRRRMEAPPPSWIDRAKWEQKTEELWPTGSVALTDPDQYVQIMQDLLSLQIDMLKDKIDQEKQTLEKDDTTQSRPDLKYRLGQLPALVGRLNEASQQLAADPDSARDALQSVALDYLALENKDDLKKMPSQMVSLYNAASRTWNDLSVVIKAPVNVPPATKLTFDEKFEPVPAAVRVRQIEQIRGLVEWVVLGVSTGVALLIAFAALYTDTWGTSIDLVAALLWGTGVNVATAGAFTGIPQLRSELISIPTGFENDK